MDLKLEDGKLHGTPVFDDSDEFAMQIYNKVENGTIRMASVGLRAIKWEIKAGDLWLEQSELREVSMVDIGANQQALALYDSNNDLIKLSDVKRNLINNQKTMEINLNSAEVLLKLNMREGFSTSAEVLEAIGKLVDLNEDQNKQIALLDARSKKL